MTNPFKWLEGKFTKLEKSVVTEAETLKNAIVPIFKHDIQIVQNAFSEAHTALDNRLKTVEAWVETEAAKAKAAAAADEARVEAKATPVLAKVAAAVKAQIEALPSETLAALGAADTDVHAVIAYVQSKLAVPAAVAPVVTPVAPAPVVVATPAVVAAPAAAVGGPATK